MATRKLILNQHLVLITNGESKKEMKVEYITVPGNVYRRFRVRQGDYLYDTKSLQYSGQLQTFEILDLNGFDFDVPVPDFSVLVKKRVGTENFASVLKVPANNFSGKIYLMPPIEPAGTLIWEDYFFKNVGEDWDSQNCEDPIKFNNQPVTINEFGKSYDVYEEIEFVIPYKYTLDIINETGVGLNDGQVTINQDITYGGEAPFEYRIVSGPVNPTWQASNVFSSLPPGSYTARIRDANNETSRTIPFEIAAFTP